MFFLHTYDYTTVVTFVKHEFLFTQGNKMITMANKSSKWLNQKFLQWQQLEGERKTIGDFAAYLTVGEAALGHWMNGRRDPSFPNAKIICEKLNDNSLLIILGFNQISDDTLASFPSDIRERLTRAKIEIEKFLIQNETSPDSPEAIQKVTEILGLYGIGVTGRFVSDNESSTFFIETTPDR